MRTLLNQRNSFVEKHIYCLFFKVTFQKMFRFWYQNTGNTGAGVSSHKQYPAQVTTHELRAFRKYPFMNTWFVWILKTWLHLKAPNSPLDLSCKCIYKLYLNQLHFLNTDPLKNNSSQHGCITRSGCWTPRRRPFSRLWKSLTNIKTLWFKCL